MPSFYSFIFFVLCYQIIKTNSQISNVLVKLVSYICPLDNWISSSVSNCL